MEAAASGRRASRSPTCSSRTSSLGGSGRFGATNGRGTAHPPAGGGLRLVLVAAPSDAATLEPFPGIHVIDLMPSSPGGSHMVKPSR